jgi:hypothetical protein
MFGAARMVKRRKVLVYGSDRGDCEGFLTFPRRRAKRYSSELLVACVILNLCWLCSTLLRVWRVMPIRAWTSKWVNHHNEDKLASKQVNLGKKSLCHHLIPRWLVFIIIHSLWLIDSFGDWLILVHGGITLHLSRVFTFLSVAWSSSVASFEGKQ